LPATHTSGYKLTSEKMMKSVSPSQKRTPTQDFKNDYYKTKNHSEQKCMPKNDRITCPLYML